MSRRRTKKIVHKTEFLREEFFETKEIYEAAKLDLLSQIKTIQSDLNVYDKDLDAQYQKSPTPKAPHSDTPSTNNSESDTESIDSPELESANVLKHPAWAKSLYRKISIKSHPDKILTEADDEKERKSALYNEASQSYSLGDYATLVMVGIDLNVSLPDSDDIIKILNNQCKKYVSDTNDLKSSIFWSWYNASSNQKQEILRQFVKDKGWTHHRSALKKSRENRGPGKSIAWLRKKLENTPEDV